MPQLSEPLPSVVLTYNDVLPNTSGHVYFELPSWDRPINYFGASGKSVGLRVEVEPAEMEEDGGLEVLPVAVTACRYADRLDS